MVLIFNPNLEIIDDKLKEEIRVVDVFSLMGLFYTAVYIDTAFTVEGEFMRIAALAFATRESENMSEVIFQ